MTALFVGICTNILVVSLSMAKAGSWLHTLKSTLDCSHNLTECKLFKELLKVEPFVSSQCLYYSFIKGLVLTELSQLSLSLSSVIQYFDS